MNTTILLSRIIDKFIEQKVSQVEGYVPFGYLGHTDKTVTVSRKNGEDTPVSFAALTVGIEAFRAQPELYNSGPSALRKVGITHVTSPVWSLLHLLDQQDYL